MLTNEAGQPIQHWSQWSQTWLPWWVLPEPSISSHCLGARAGTGGKCSECPGYYIVERLYCTHRCHPNPREMARAYVERLRAARAGLDGTLRAGVK